jgi:hypothetical protein
VAETQQFRPVRDDTVSSRLPATLRFADAALADRAFGPISGRNGRKEAVMLVRDIVNSCSNPHVAEAAVGSIGGSFARRVREAASGRGVRAGAWTAEAVLRFRSRARSDDLERLQRAVAGDDQPILSGLRMIVEAELPATDASA